uniref:CHAT domain-containing protein n=1 Tax=Myxosarcina sp. GI1 TaxID=1541065 RepID=UPI000691D318
PGTETPGTETPVTETPVTETPGTSETPGTETPGTETPVTETPETPGTETPVTETPGTGTPETPVTETPETETPGTETPETPVTETPETPGTETPVTETPETPGTSEIPGTPETPVTETPVTETPETPVTETPETPGTETPVTETLEIPETLTGTDIDVTDTTGTETLDTADTEADVDVIDTPDITDAIDAEADTITETPESVESESTAEASFENFDGQNNTGIETSPEIINETVMKALAEGNSESAVVESTAEVNEAGNLETTSTETKVDSLSGTEVDLNAEEPIATTESNTSNENETETELESESADLQETELEAIEPDSIETEVETQEETVAEESAEAESETEVETSSSDTENELNAEEPVATIESNTSSENETETELETESADLQETELEAIEPDSIETEVETQEETVAEESAEAESDSQEQESEESTDKAKEEERQSDFEPEVDRLAYEVQVQQSDFDVAIQLQEEFQATQLIDTSGLQIYGKPPSTTEISQRLGQLWLQTGKKAAFINVSLQSNQLETFVVLPTVNKSALDNPQIASTKISAATLSNTQPANIRKTVQNASRSDVLAIATQFREEVSNVRNLRQTSYINSAQKLYQLLIEPIEAELEANNVDVLVFSMDSGLRLLPIAALNDGKQFLIEKYAVALVPSFGLTDTRYVNLNQGSILAMGASKFAEQAALPTMPIELQKIVSDPRQGEIFLNEQFTIANFKAQNLAAQRFPIIHLGTHAAFQKGSLNNSYIQFYNEKLNLSELRTISDELGWNSSDTTPVELLVLSACQTALGDEEAELGFAGLAVQAGVKSALASLWYISDLGTLALMSEFYDRLGDTLTKAEALRQTQLAMLEGKVLVDDGRIELTKGDSVALPAEFPHGTLELSHPYFWSAFTLIGNWN